MTPREWNRIEGLIAAAWPNAKLMDEDQVRLRHKIVQDLDAEVVTAEVERLARGGREFPPNPGQLFAAVAEQARPAAPTPGAIISVLNRAASKYGASPYNSRETQLANEAAAIREIAAESPHAARFIVEHGWRQYCREGLDDVEYGGAVRQRLERSIAGSIAGVEREYREGRVLPQVREHLARLDAGAEPSTGLRQLNVADVIPLRPELGSGPGENVQEAS